MKGLRLLMLSCILLTGMGVICSKKVIIADGNDRNPVAGVSVIGPSGLIIGFTDKKGTIEIEAEDSPFTVRCMGYESITGNYPADSIFLTPATYSLKEFVIAPQDRPVARIVTYAREYCSGATTADTIQMYSDYMLEYFFADGKVKGFKKTHQSPHVLAVRRFARISNPLHPDSIFRPGKNDDAELLSFLTNITFLPYWKHRIPDAMIQGELSDTIRGKYGIATVTRYVNDLYIESGDLLANYKDHRWSPWFFKLLGMTMDAVDWDWASVYKRNDRQEYGIEDFISGRYNLRIIGSGKILKKLLGIKENIEINCLIEQYPVEIEYLTPEEYKECKKDFYSRTAEFSIPANTEPLPESVQRFLNRFDKN